MEEKTILKISLISILIGLTFLFLYSEEMELQTVENVEDFPVTETIKLSGTVTKVRQMDKVSFITVSGHKEVESDVIVFPDEKIFIKEGNLVEITGSVEEYKGKKEVIANKVIIK